MTSEWRRALPVCTHNGGCAQLSCRWTSSAVVLCKCARGGRHSRTNRRAGWTGSGHCLCCRELGAHTHYIPTYTPPTAFQRLPPPAHLHVQHLRKGCGSRRGGLAPSFCGSPTSTTGSHKGTPFPLSSVTAVCAMMAPRRCWGVPPLAPCCTADPRKSPKRLHGP